MRCVLLLFVFYSLGYVVRGIVRLYNPGSLLGDLVTDALVFLAVFLVAWAVVGRRECRE